MEEKVYLPTKLGGNSGKGLSTHSQAKQGRRGRFLLISLLLLKKFVKLSKNSLLRDGGSLFNGFNQSQLFGGIYNHPHMFFFSSLLRL